MKRNVHGLTLSACFACVACVDTGTQNVELDLYLAGSSETSFESDDGWQVTLEEARLAFGPLTLCPGANAGPFCHTAVAEWLDSTVVNALEEQPQLAGSLIGSDGVVRGFMYDLGLANLITSAIPIPLDAANELEGNSLVISGSAVKGEVSLDLDFGITILDETSDGIPVFLSASFQSLNQDLGEVSSLTLRFEPTDWLRTVSFDTLAETVCAEECPETVNVVTGTQAYSALRIAVLANPPEFDWD